MRLPPHVNALAHYQAGDILDNSVALVQSLSQRRVVLDGRLLPRLLLLQPCPQCRLRPLQLYGLGLSEDRFHVALPLSYASGRSIFPASYASALGRAVDTC